MFEMTRRSWIAAFVAAVALASVPSASATEWYREREMIPVGEAWPAPIKGWAILTLRGPGGKKPTKTRCTIKGVHDLLNLGFGGPATGTITALTFTCPKLSVTASLPWPTSLADTAWPLPDQWEDVSVAVAGYGTFTGSLAPVIGDKDYQDSGAPGGPIDDADYKLKLKRSSKLEAPDGSTLSLFGKLALGGKHDDAITGEVESADLGSPAWLGLQALRKNAERKVGLGIAELREEGEREADLDDGGD